MYDEVAAPVAVQVLDALTVERDDLAGLGAGPDVDVGGAVQAVTRQRGPQRGGDHRDRHRAVQVIALPLEDGVRTLDDLQEQVAGRAAAGADFALAGQLDVRAVLDARRDPHLDRPSGPHPAVAVALRAGPDQHGAVPAAAGADPGHHHLADERTGDLADLAAAAADVTGLRVGARRGALTGAGGADHGRVHGEFPGGADRPLGGLQLDPDRRVAAALRAAARPAARRAAAGRAEELVKQVIQRIEPSAERTGTLTP